MNDAAPNVVLPVKHASLAAAKLAVMAEVPYLRKSKAQGLQYTFASEREFLRRLHPVMVRHGLTLAPHEVKVAASEHYQTAKGSAMNRVLLLVSYRMSHEGSSGFELIQVAGEGADVGDKATSKAMTSCLKYALRQAFLIETGDDPDRQPSDEQERRPLRAAPDQQSAPRPQAQAPATPPAAAPASNGTHAAKAPASPKRDPHELIDDNDQDRLRRLMFEKGKTWPALSAWLQSKVDFPKEGKFGDINYQTFEMVMGVLTGKRTKV